MNARIIFGLVLVAVGISAFTGFSVLRLAFAVILIVWGVRVLSQKSHTDSGMHMSADMLNEVIIFGPADRVVSSEHFKGGKIVVLFGGGDLDLRQSHIHDHATLEAVVIFGGLRVIVPSQWQVESGGTAVAGAFDNRAQSGSQPPALKISGVAVCGGIQIVNEV